MTQRNRRSGALRGRPFQARTDTLRLHLPLKPTAVAVAVALVALGGAGLRHAAAAPTDGVVSAGSATILQSGAVTTINQTSARAAIDWRTFGIRANESVIFQQPSSSAVALNRVAAGAGRSEIYGSLQANGHVFLINPAGVLFARGATVDVAGLVASTLNITNNDFMASRLVFSGGDGSGSVRNEADSRVKDGGHIRARDGGYVAFLGNQVSNAGTISAPNGTVALGAGESMVLDFHGDGLLSLKVNAAAAKSRIDNMGEIHAEGGAVIMSARAKDALLDTVLNVDGIVTAKGLVERGGYVYLDGGSSGVTSVSGTLDASSALAKGGEIRVLGENVGLFGNAKLDASGATGGGTVLVGGGFQGKEPGVPNATAAFVSRNAQVRADALTSGEGGTIVIWSDDTTKAHGSFSAKGGALSGNGGLVETSGHRHLDVAGARVDTRAADGSAGTWLLDPFNVTVAHAGATGTSSPAFDGGNPTDTFTPGTDNSTVTDADINQRLLTTNVTITTAGAGGQEGDVTVNGDVLIFNGASATRTFNLTADGSIVVNAGAQLGASATPGARNVHALNVELIAAGSITQNGAITTTPSEKIPSGFRFLAGAGRAGGTVLLRAGAAITGAGLITSVGDSGEGGVDLGSEGQSGGAGGNGGEIFITSAGAGDISLTSAITAAGGKGGGGGNSGNSAGFGAGFGGRGGDGGVVTIRNQAGTISAGPVSAAAGERGDRGIGCGTRGGCGGFGIPGSGGTIQLWSVGGSITQSGAFTAASLKVVSDADVTLQHANNDVGIVAANLTGAGNSFHYSDSNALSVGTVASLGSGDASMPAASGITAGGEVSLSAAGVLTVSQSVSGGPVSLTGADFIFPSGTITSTGNVILAPSANTTAINVGGASGFAVSNDEISRITTPALLTIGSTANTGGITVGAAEAIDAGSKNVELVTAGTLTVNAARGMTTTGTTTLTANGMTLAGGAISGSAVTLRPTSGAQIIDLGGADAAGTLGLTSAEIDSVTSAGVFTIGRDDGSAAGNITVTQPIAPSGTNTLILRTGGSITQNAGATITETNLGLVAATGVTLTEAGNSVTNISGLVTGTGDFTFRDANSAFSVGNLPTVHSSKFVTIQTGSGAISLEGTQVTLGPDRLLTDGGDVTVSGPALVSAGNFFVNTAVGTSGKAGNVRFGNVSGGGLAISARGSNIGASTDDGAITLGAVTSPALYAAGSTVQIGPGSSLGTLGVLQTEAGAAFTYTDPDALNTSLSTAPLGIGAFEFILGITTNNGAITLATVDGDLRSGFSSSAGNSTLSLTAGGSGRTLEIESSVSGSGGVTLTADRMTIGPGGANAGASTATLRPFSAGRLVGLGSTGNAAANTLELSELELDRVNAGTLTIGRNDAGNAAGDISVTAPITRAAPVTLVLLTAGAITQTTGSTITASTLVLASGTGVTLTQAGNDVDVLAAVASATGAAISFTDVDSVTIGAAGGLSGITTAGGAVAVSASGGITSTSAGTINTSGAAGLAGASFGAAGGVGGDGGGVGGDGGNVLLKSSGSGTISLGAAIIADGGKGGDGALGIPGGAGGTGGSGGLITIMNGGGPIELSSLSAVGGPGGERGADSVPGGCCTSAGQPGTGGAIQLSATAGITQEAATRISAGSLVVLAGGPVLLDNANTVDTLAARVTTGSFGYTNNATLTVGSLTPVGDLASAGAVSGIQTTGASSGTTVNVTTGNLVLDSAVGNADATSALTSAGNITGPGTVTGATVVVDSGTGIGVSSASRLNTAAGTLAARTRGTSGGGVFVAEADAVTLSTVGAVANGTAGAAAYEVAAGGTIAIDGPVATKGGAITLLTTAGAISSTAAGTITTTSADSAATASGTVQVTSATSIDLLGKIDTRAARASAIAVPAGGVALTGPGGIAVAEIDTSGNGADGVAGGSAAGTIAFGSPASITLRGNITARGGDGNLGSGTAGNGANLTFGAPVTLAGDVTIDTRAGTNAANPGTDGNVTFSGTVNSLTAGSEKALTVNTAGATTFSGAVGGTTQLASLTTNAAGTTNIDGGSVRTTGAQLYGEPVTIGGTAGAAAELRGSSLTFNGALTAGNHPLTLTTDAYAFNGNVTGSSTLLIQTTADNVAMGIAGGSLDRLQDGFSSITLGRATSTAATTVGGAVTFHDPVTIRGGSVVVNGGITGDGDASITLTAGAGGIALNNDVTTANQAIALNGAVTLGGATRTLTAGSGAIAFSNAVDGAAGLVVSNTGTTAFNGAVGGTTPLASLTTDAGGTTNIDGGGVRTTGAQFYGDAVTIGGAAGAAELTGASLTFNGALTAGNHPLTLTTDAFAFNGNVTGSSTLLIQPTADTVAMSIPGGSFDRVQDGFSSITLGRATSTSATTIGGGVTFHDPLTIHGRSIVVNGGITGDGDASVTLAAGAGGIALNNDVTTANQAIALNGPVVLGADATVDAGTAGITFGSTIDGGFALVLNSGETTLLGDSVGAATPLASLSTNAGGTTALARPLSGGVLTVTTSGAQTYNDDVLLNAETTLTSTGAGASGNITFNRSINPDVTLPPRGLTVNTAGTTTFGDAIGDDRIGAVTSLWALVTDAGGTTVFNINPVAGSPSVRTSTNQEFGDPVRLGQDTTLFSRLGTTIEFKSSVDSLDAGAPRALAVNTAGTTRFEGVVGGAMPPASLATDAGGTTEINTGRVTTAGAQTYNDTVVLGTHTILTSTAGGDITIAAGANSRTAGGCSEAVFTQPCAGASALTLDTAGTMRLGDNVGDDRVGAVAPLQELITRGGGTTVFDIASNGTSVFTLAKQTYEGPVVLGQDTRLSSLGLVSATQNSATFESADAIMFQGSVDSQTTGSERSLTIGSASGFSIGSATFGDNLGDDRVGAIVPLRSLTAQGARFDVSSSGGPAVTTLGPQTYGSVTLSQHTTLRSRGTGAEGDIAFTGPVDSAAAGFERSLAVETAGTTRFASPFTVGGGIAVGANVPLQSLTTDGAGSTFIAGSINTIGDQTFRSAVTLGNGPVGVPSSMGTGNPVVFNAGAGNITFERSLDGGALAATSSGTTTFGGAVGNASPLVSVTTDGGGVTAINGGLVQTTGVQAYNDAVTLGAHTILTGLTPTFGSTVTGAGFDLTLNFSGTTAINSGFTGIRNLNTGNGGLTELSGAITTSGAQTYNDAVALGANTALTGSTGTFGSTIAGAGFDLALDFSSDTTVSGTTFSNVRDFSTGGGGTTRLSGAIGTTGTQTYGDAVTLDGHTTLTGTTPTFGSTVSGAGFDLALTFTGTTGINSSFAGIRNLTTAGGGLTELSGAITTSGAQTYNDAVSLAGNTTLTGTTPTFGSTVAGAGFDLTLDFSGTTAINSGFTGIRNLTSGNGGLTELSGAIITSGAQNYNDAVALGANTVLTGSAGTFGSTIAGAGFDLALDFSGETAVSGTTFSNVRDFSTGGGGTTRLSGAIGTTGTQTYGDAVTLDGHTTLTGTTPTFGSTVSGAGFDLALTFTGTTGINSSFAGIRNLTTAGGGLTELSGAITTSGAQTYNDAVSLAGNTTLTGTTPTFGSTVAGAGFDLTLDFSGTTAINSGFTGIRNLTSGNGGLTELSGAITTSGAQTYNDAVALGANTALTGSTGTFGSTIAGAGFDLALDFSGETAVSGTTFGNVRNFSTGGGGTTRLSGTIETGGTQIYGDAVALDGSTILTGTTPTFGSTVTGAGFDLTLDFSGTTTIDSSFAGIRNLNTGNGGLTELSGVVTTSGAQTYNDAVSLAGNTTLTGTTPTFGSTVAGAGFDLTLNSSGTTAINSGFTGIRNLNSGNGGLTELSGAITTTGGQTYNDAVALGANTTLSGSAGTFGSTIAGAGFDLTLEFSGTTAINGGFTGIRNLTTGNGGLTELSGAITTSATQTYSNAVLLTGHTTLTGTTPTFGSTIAGAGFDLTLNFSGITDISGANFSGVRNLATGAGGTTRLAGTIATTGTQTYNDNALLAANTTLGAGVSNISFGGTVDGPFALAANSTGSTVFGGSVGATAALSSLTTNAGGTTALNGGALTTTGDLTFNDAVQLGANTTLNAAAGNISFAGSLDGAYTLALNASGTTTLAGVVGAATPLAALTADVGGTTVIGTTTVNTTGSQLYSDALTIGVNATLTSSTANVTFGSTIDADAAANNRTLTVNAPLGTVTFSGNIGANQALADLDVTAGPDTIVFNAPSAQTVNVTAGGGGNTVSFNSNVRLDQSLTVNTDGVADNNVSFNGAVNADAAANGRTLDVTSGGANVVLSAVGNAQELGRIGVGSNQLLLNGDVRTDGGGPIDFRNVAAVRLAPNILLDTDRTGGTTQAGDIVFGPGTIIDSAGVRSTLTLNTLADGGGATAFIDLGIVGPTVDLIMFGNIRTIAGVVPPAPVIDTAPGASDALRDAQDEVAREGREPGTDGGNLRADIDQAAAVPALCEARSPSSLSCED